jgi:hypothetical protein
VNARGPELRHQAHGPQDAAADALDDPRVGDSVRLRKAHPCGSHTWRVVRIGAHIGLRCAGCERKVMLVRSQYRKRVAALLERGPAPAAERD